MKLKCNALFEDSDKRIIFNLRFYFVLNNNDYSKTMGNGNINVKVYVFYFDKESVFSFTFFKNSLFVDFCAVEYV